MPTAAPNPTAPNPTATVATRARSSSASLRLDVQDLVVRTRELLVLSEGLLARTPRRRAVTSWRRAS